MEGSGPEPAKRQRLDYNGHGSHRASPQGPIIPTTASHSYNSNTLPPPPESYAQRHPVPPSPYEASIHEHRSLPDPSTATGLHIYPPSSGQNTPGREQRPFIPDFSRRGSGSARSPEDFAQPFSARPLSAAPSTEALQYSVGYSGDNTPQSASYAGHEGLINGGHGAPLSAYDQTHSRPMNQVVDYSHSPIGATPFTQNSPVYPPPNYQMFAKTKKGSRAVQACDVCRARKAKCDEGRPRCGFCTENNATCNYQEVPPAKADRANQMIIDELTAIKNELKGHKEEIRSLRSDLNGSSITSASSTTEMKGAQTASSGSRTLKTEISIDKTAFAEASPRFLSNKQLEQSPSGSHFTSSTDTPSAVPNPGPLREAKERAPVIEHDTAAHKLLRWPQIAELMRKNSILAQLAANDDYVMRLEEDKGVLRVFGRGQGRDTGDGGEPGPNSPAPSNTSKGSDESDPGSPRTPPEGLWGFGFIPPTAHEPRVNDEFGNNSDFSLNIHPKTLNRLLQSYLHNLHRLHPFLDKSRLSRMVERFASRYNSGAERSLTKELFSPPPHNAAVDAIKDSSNHYRAGKRKHSESGSYNAHIELSSTAGEKAAGVTFERSASTAIVLLVMALGKICEWKAPLPGIAASYKPGFKRSSYQDTSINSPSAHSAGSQSSPYAGGVPSPMSLTRSDHSTKSYPSDELAQPRNVDFIPGLAYYAPATDILGNLHGSNDLAHVQACLLAGLYAGQLARAFESWSWISTASRTCRFLVREPELSKEREPRKDLIKFAFWTCSQLESDLLADLDLPRSGIQDIEVGLPKGYIETFVGWDDPDALMMAFYSAQIHIRNRLNDIQLNLHPSEATSTARLDKMLALRTGLHTSLCKWRSLLPAPLAWSDGADLPNDINHARLRAKYYGAMCIVHRPFLRIALDNRLVARTPSPQRDRAKALRAPEDMPPPLSATDQMDMVLDSAELCVQAAMASTVAFDGVMGTDRRLVVTNIFGTAHAQFGNMLILSATFRDPGLSILVPRWRIEGLFNRTIALLSSLGKSSETLAQDAKILSALKDITLEDTPAEKQVRSFSSNEGG